VNNPHGADSRKNHSYRKVDTAVVHDFVREVSNWKPVTGSGPIAPLILYSPVSWLLLLPTLSAEEALEPTVSTLSKSGAFIEASVEPGRRFSSCGLEAPARRVNGFRIGILTD
jgi:hypothetical protein